MLAKDVKNLEASNLVLTFSAITKDGEDQAPSLQTVETACPVSNPDAIEPYIERASHENLDCSHVVTLRNRNTCCFIPSFFPLCPPASTLLTVPIRLGLTIPAVRCCSYPPCPLPSASFTPGSSRSRLALLIFRNCCECEHT